VTAGTATAPAELTVHAGPRRTLSALRIVAVAHALAVLAQPVLAGSYLSGELDALSLHSLNAHVLSGLGVFQLIAAVVFVWGGRGRTWPLYATVGFVLAEQVQVGVGFEGLLAVHIPLGVSIVSLQVLLTVWLFRDAARTVRVRRRRSR
jgi:hypothetical protein